MFYSRCEGRFELMQVINSSYFVKIPNIQRYHKHCRTFRNLERNGNKSLNFEEFKVALCSNDVDFSDEEIRTMFDKFDENKCGMINTNEFLAKLRVICH